MSTDFFDKCWEGISQGLSRISATILPSNDQKKEKSEPINSQPIPALSLSQDKKKDPWILVLIINAGNTDLLQNFKQNSKVTLNEAEELYRSTRALWMGNQTNFLQSGLKKRIDEEHALTEEEPSEYDVYFVQLELKEPHPGFKHNAKSIDKSDAFKMLPEIVNKVKVSPRLPCKSYENTGVYLL